MEDMGPARAKMPSAVMEIGRSAEAVEVEWRWECRDDWEPYELPGGLSVVGGLPSPLYLSLSLSLWRGRPKNLRAEDWRPPLLSMLCASWVLYTAASTREARPEGPPVPPSGLS